MKVKVGVGGNDALEIDVLGMGRHVMDTRWAGLGNGAKKHVYGRSTYLFTCQLDIDGVSMIQHSAA